MGPTTDFSNFMGAVIDDRAFAKLSGAIDRAHKNADVDVAAGGTYDDSEGYFHPAHRRGEQGSDQRVLHRGVLPGRCWAWRLRRPPLLHGHGSDGGASPSTH